MNLFNREQRIAQGPPTQADYERVLEEIATIRMQKVLSYGEDRYTTDPAEQEHHLFITYSDVYRKFIRIKEFFTRGLKVMKAKDGESLRDAFLDLANYGIMGVQLLDKLPKQTEPDFKIDQVAFCTQDPDGLKTLLMAVFGSPLEWHTDQVVAKGQVFGHDSENQAELNFNYQVMAQGVEFEVLCYKEGTNWLGGQKKGLSHLGTHVDDLAAVKERLLGMGLTIAQEVNTLSHTNPAIKDTRRYWYCIFDTRNLMGFDLKLIQRLPSLGSAFCTTCNG